MGVMGDLGTTMRDPVFFSLHSFVDDIFHEHKATLPRYQPGQVGLLLAIPPKANIHYYCNNLS